MYLYFEECHITSKKETARELIAHGFYKQATTQDFPLRVNTVYLHVKRHIWLDKITKEIAKRAWDIVAQATRITSEFSAFLKQISQN